MTKSQCFPASAQEIGRAVSFLRGGHPIAFPTETVYGLGAPIFHEAAISQIFTLKRRPADNPLIAHVASLSQVEQIAQEIPPLFYRLADHFWPGPLTIVLKKQQCVPHLVSGGQSSIAVRMPSHSFARGLIEALGEPIVAPSANISGRPSPTSCADILEDFEGAIIAVFDGGPSPIGIESTVISLLQTPPILLRPGHIQRSELEEFLSLSLALPTQDTPLLSPGMKYRHYAPRAPVYLFRQQEAFHQFIQKERCHVIQEPTHHSLYRSLRDADRGQARSIALYCNAQVLADEALMNRLARIGSFPNSRVIATDQNQSPYQSIDCPTQNLQPHLHESKLV